MSEVTLSVIGLSTQEGTVVNVAANLLAALNHSIKVLEAGDSSGDIVLLSPSSHAGVAALESLAATQRAVLFVDSEGEVNGYPTLLRPVRVQTLRDLLIELVSRIPARERQDAASKPAVAQKPPAGKVISTELPGNLFYRLLDAMQQRTMQSVGNGETVVLLHGPSQCIYTQADNGHLEALAKQRSENLSVLSMRESDFMQASRGMPLTRLHDLIWLAERHGSHGILLPGNSLDTPVRLKVWPKFNTRHVRPEYLKLAAMLSKQPLTLRAAAEASGIALSQVIDFYNTSVVFGVIETMASAPIVSPTPKASASGGLLAKIAKRLALKRD